MVILVVKTKNRKRSSLSVGGTVTNQEQYEIIRRCVQAVGVQSFCFCQGAQEKLCTMLRTAGIDSQLVYKIGARRTRVAGMRGCCVPVDRFLAEAAKILEVEASSTS